MTGKAMKLKFGWLVVSLLLAACGSAEPQPTATPTVVAVVQQAEAPATATVAPTDTPASAPTAPATTEATVAPTGVVTAATPSTDWVNTASVDGDFYVRGNPSAPIRLIDFSDFL